MTNLASNPLFLLPFGIFVGIFSGLMGLGGGAVIIPVLVLAFSLDQQTAHGTSLAMILSPTALPAIWQYHAEHHVNWRLVLWVVPGMAAGSYIGAKIATSISTDQLRLIFGMILIYVAAYTIFGKAHLVRSISLAGVLVLIATILYGITRWVDSRSAG